MEVRGAPLIGGTAAYGIALAIQENNDPEFIKKSAEELIIIKTYSYKFEMGSRSNDEEIIRY